MTCSDRRAASCSPMDVTTPTLMRAPTNALVTRLRKDCLSLVSSAIGWSSQVVARSYTLLGARRIGPKITCTKERNCRLWRTRQGYRTHGGASHQAHVAGTLYLAG